MQAELDLESMILAENQTQADPANEVGDSSDADKENMPPTEEPENIPPAKKTESCEKQNIEKEERREKK